MTRLSQDDVLALASDHGMEDAANIIAALEALDRLSEDNRCVVFAFFCSFCGSGDPGCQCWNDE